MAKPKAVVLGTALAAAALAGAPAQELVNKPEPGAESGWRPRVTVAAPARFAVLADSPAQADAQKEGLLLTIALGAEHLGKWGFRTAPGWRAEEARDWFGDGSDAKAPIGIAAKTAYVLDVTYLDAPLAERGENVYSVADLLSEEQAALADGRD